MGNFENIRLPWSDWKIVKYLGGGGYGKVYEIERTFFGIQEKAALKIVSRPKDESEIEGYYGKDYDKAEVRKAYEMQIQSYMQEYKLMKNCRGIQISSAGMILQWFLTKTGLVEISLSAWSF